MVGQNNNCLTFDQACPCSKTVEFTGCAQELQQPTRGLLLLLLFINYRDPPHENQQAREDRQQQDPHPHDFYHP